MSNAFRDRKKIVGYGGALILFIGLFCPIIKGPLGQTLSLLDVWQFFVVSLAGLVVSALLLLRGMNRLLFAAALITLLINGFWLAAFIGARSQVEYGLEYVALSWGWALLLLGPALLMAAAIIRPGGKRATPATGDADI